MKTRSGGYSSLRGPCVAALSAASIGLLGLALTQQSPSKLATADSPLSSSARTALGGTEHDKAAKPGSSDQDTREQVIVCPDDLDTGENKAFEDSKANIRIASAQYFVEKLGIGALSKWKPPLVIDETAKQILKDKLRQISLTAEEKAQVYGTEKVIILSSFNYFNPKSEPKPETEVVKPLIEDPARYVEIMTKLFVDLAYATQRHVKSHDESGRFKIERPITMFALFRSDPFTRFMILTLPYMIDRIAERFFSTAEFYGFDIITALPELQQEKPSPLSFTYVTASDDKFTRSVVKRDDKTVVTTDYPLENGLPLFLGAEALSQLIEYLKSQAEIPTTHKLVVASVILTDPMTNVEITVLCSDVGVFESLRRQLGNSNCTDHSVRISTITCADAIFVDREYCHLMKNHIVETFNLFQNCRFLDDNVKDESKLLLDKMKEGFGAIPEN